MSCRDALRIAFIGAGSTVFARVLLRDLFALDDVPPLDIRLMDTDPERLRVTEAVARRLAAEAAAAGGRAPARITATMDRRAALEGADYVICLVQIGGFRPATVADFEIPKRYGLVQTIGDTLGIGGIMRGLRTIPFLQDLARDMKECCPGAWLFNYANPLAINQWALEDAGIKTVGLCHSVRRTARQLAGYLGVPFEKVEYRAAGINHMAFFLRFAAEGRDLYPDLRAMVAEGRIPAHDRVRFEVMAHFGYFVSESSFHFAEYVPYFLRPDRPGAIEHYQLPLDEYLRRCGVYEEQFNALRAEVDRAEREAALADTARTAGDAGAGEPARAPGEAAAGGPAPAAAATSGTPATRGPQSDEDVAWIIHSLETGQGRLLHANVRNGGAIENLPPDCIVEVPCYVDRFGLRPLRMGRLPSHLAALIETNVNVQRLTVEAAYTGDPEAAKRAAMLDPRTAALLPLDQIASLVEELLLAHRQWLPQFRLPEPAARGAAQA
ncbi:MAG TPA: alpha-glucosidase/alpha-galactosidase [Limnochordales bacterium]